MFKFFSDTQFYKNQILPLRNAPSGNVQDFETADLSLSPSEIRSVMSHAYHSSGNQKILGIKTKDNHIIEYYFLYDIIIKRTRTKLNTDRTRRKKMLFVALGSQVGCPQWASWLLYYYMLVINKFYFASGIVKEMNIFIFLKYYFQRPIITFFFI